VRGSGRSQPRDTGAAIPVLPWPGRSSASTNRLVGKTVDRDGLATAQTPQGVRRSLLERAWQEFARTAPRPGPTRRRCWRPVESRSMRSAAKDEPEGDCAGRPRTRPSDGRSSDGGLGGSAGLLPWPAHCPFRLQWPFTSAPPCRRRKGRSRPLIAIPFGPGSPLKLGGITFEEAPRLAGHSDGDVALHAVPTALLGAAGLGDLGRLFPADARTPAASTAGVPPGLRGQDRGRGRLVDRVGGPDYHRRQAASRAAPPGDERRDRRRAPPGRGSSQRQGITGNLVRTRGIGPLHLGQRHRLRFPTRRPRGRNHDHPPFRHPGWGDSRFRSARAGRACVYSCGPTVYGPAHVGNFRSFLFADLLVRYLRHRGFAVTWVMNIHRRRRRIIKGRTPPASRSGSWPSDTRSSWWRTRRGWHDDAGLDASSHRSRSPDGGIDRAAAREGPRLPHGGRLDLLPHRLLAHLRTAGQAGPGGDAGRRAVSRPTTYGKERPARLRALEGPAAGEPSWETAIGPGRPGWHVECSAMSMYYLASRSTSTPAGST